MADNFGISNTLLDTLEGNPYIHKAYVFGSCSLLCDDDLSDIDLTVTTEYPHLVDAMVRSSLNEQNGIEAIYTITSTKHEIARTIFLKDRSLFRKIDIGFSLPSKAALFPNSKLIYQNKHTKQPTEETLKQADGCVESSEEHRYMDILMGSLRYIKHRYRQEHWSAYKCYRGFIDQVAAELTPDSELSAIAYKTLDNQKNDEIVGLFFEGGISEKDHMYYEYIKRFIARDRFMPAFGHRVIGVWQKFLTAQDNS